MDFSHIFEIDFFSCYKAIKDNWKMIAGTTLLGLFIGILVAAFHVEPRDEYDAMASVYSMAYGSYTESAEGIQAIKTYSQVVKSLRVAERAELLLGDNSIDKYEIYDMIYVEDYMDTSSIYPTDNAAIIKIHAKSTSQEDAIKVVNAVANAYVLEVNSIMQSSGSVQVLDEAYTCERTYMALKVQGIYIGLITALGLIIPMMVLIFMTIFSPKINTIKEGTLYGDMELLGLIPEKEKN